MTAEAQKQPKAAGMKEIDPTLEALFCDSSSMTADLLTGSAEKTVVMPVVMPSLCSFLRI